MYAIIRAGGHQEKVTPGETITVDRMHKEIGEEIKFTPLVVSTDEGEVVTDKAALEASAAVVGKILDHIKGEKVEIFQYRQKTNYRRHTGHRQPLTLVEITEIRIGDKTVTAEQARTAAEEAKRKGEEERAAKAAEPKKVTPKKKVVAKKAAPAAKKAAPAKKSTAKKKAAPKKTESAE